MFRATLIISFVLLTNSLLPAQVPAERGIKGQQAPAWDVAKWYQLPSGTKSLDRADFQGKTVYLYCFQSWCPGCHSQGFPTLKTVSKHYSGDDQVAFVAIQTVFEGHQVNTFKKARAVARKFDLKIPIGHVAGDRNNPTPPMMSRYRTGGTPWTIIISPAGEVQFNDFHIAPEQAIAIIDSNKQ